MDIPVGTQVVREDRFLRLMVAAEDLHKGDGVRWDDAGFCRRDDGDVRFAIANEDISAGSAGWIEIPPVPIRDAYVEVI